MRLLELRKGVIGFAIVAGALAGWPTGTPIDARPLDRTAAVKKLAEIDLPQTTALIEAACAEDRFSGIVTVLRHQHAVFQHSCAGSDGATDTIGADTNFKLFSTSKQFTATLIMLLAEDGVLSLDDPASAYLDFAPESWRDVSIHDLLVHSSGLPDLTQGLLEQYQSGVRRHSEAVAGSVASAQDVSPDPGAGWAYNNFGYELLAVIAEQATGEDFVWLMQRYLFDPVGMDGATIETIDSEAEELTGLEDPHLVQGFNGTPGDKEPAVSYSFVQRGAGAIRASANNLSNYYHALERGDVVSKNLQNKIRAAAVMVKKGVQNTPGWFVRDVQGYEILSHSGGNNGYISWFGYAPEIGVGIIILSNYGFASAGDLRDAIFADVLARPASGPN